MSSPGRLDHPFRAADRFAPLIAAGLMDVAEVLPLLLDDAAREAPDMAPSGCRSLIDARLKEQVAAHRRARELEQARRDYEQVKAEDEQRRWMRSEAGQHVLREAEAISAWKNAEPLSLGSPGVDYLLGCGIDLVVPGPKLSLRPQPSLRFHPQLWRARSKRSLPAMLAGIVAPDGRQLVGCACTWLEQDRSGEWRQASVAEPRMVLGNVDGGCIRLSSGASGKPLQDAPEGETVAIATSSETGLSIAIDRPQLRVLAAASLDSMARIVLPLTVHSVILCADDTASEELEAALGRARARFAGQGRKMHVERWGSDDG